MRVLIVDDEPLACEGLRLRLAAEPNVEVAGACGSGRAAVAAIRNDPPDLVLLDVQMPGLDGFDVLEQVGVEHMPPVVFVTAYDHHALRAFEVHALDYLLKPVDQDRLRQALARARDRMRERDLQQLTTRLQALLTTLKRPEPAAPPEAPVPDPIVVRSHGRVVFLPLDEVTWIEAAGDYVCLHTGEKDHLLRDTMTHMEDSLPPHFRRIHRSCIVNLRCIRELHARDHGEYAVILQDGTRLKLSRSYRDALEAALGTAR